MTLLTFVDLNAKLVDVGITVKRIPVKNSVKEPDVVALISNVSIDFEIVVIILYL